jgi:hypothetical protein
MIGPKYLFFVTWCDSIGFGDDPNSPLSGLVGFSGHLEDLLVLDVVKSVHDGTVLQWIFK